MFTTAQLVIVCVTVLAITAGVLLARRPGRPADTGGESPPRVRHRVTVHTKQPDDQTLYGVLVADYEDRLVLDHAEYVTAKGARALPGRAHIATRDISWIDVHDLTASAPAAAPSTTRGDALETGRE